MAPENIPVDQVPGMAPSIPVDQVPGMAPRQSMRVDQVPGMAPGNRSIPVDQVPGMAPLNSAESNPGRDPSVLHIRGMDKIYGTEGQPDITYPGGKLFGLINLPDIKVSAAEDAMNKKIYGTNTAGLYGALASGPALSGAGLLEATAARPLSALLMAPLSIPQRAMTNLTLNAAADRGVPGARDLADKINPDRNLLAPTNPGEITQFYMDKTGKALDGGGMSGLLKSALQNPFAQFLGGATTNFFVDPMRMFTFNQPTSSAIELQKIGNTSPASQAKNLMTIRMPLTDKVVAEVPMESVAPAVKALQSIPGVNLAAAFAKAFGTDTGVAKLDRTIKLNNMEGYGQDNAIRQGYLKPEVQKNLTPEEKQMIFALGEEPGVGNLQHRDVPDSTIEPVKDQFVSEDQMRAHMEKNLPVVAERMGFKLTPGREAMLVESAMNAKRADSAELAARVRSEHVTVDNIQDKVLPDHMPHVMDPAYEIKDGVPTPEAAKILDSVKGRGYLSTRDTTRQRTIQGSVREANQYIEQTYGKKNFFIEDPHVATAMRLSQALKLERSTRVINDVAETGVRRGTAEGKRAEKEGWQPIDHPAFNEKNVTLFTPKGETANLTIDRSGQYKLKKGVHETVPLKPRGETEVPAGTVQTVKHGELIFPPDVAMKVSHYINAKAVYNLGGMLGSALPYAQRAIDVGKDLNQISRASTFLSPLFWVRNMISNMSKALGDGVSPLRFVQAAKILWNKGAQGLNKTNPETGANYTSKDIALGAAKYGFNESNTFQEGASDFVAQLKQMGLKDALSNGRPVAGAVKQTAQTMTKAMNMVAVLGQKGENLVRMASYIHYLDEGWHPAEAALQVNRVQFDYRFNSPLTDVARFFRPITQQHATKTLGAMPQLVGKNPAYWNFVTNSFPQILANAANDPTTQEMINHVVDPRLRMQNLIWGPLMGGNSWYTNILTNPKQPGELPSMAYYNPNLGFEVVDQLDVFSQAARDKQAFMNYGLSPVMGALARVLIVGHDQKGKAFQDASDNVGYLIRKGVMGNFNFPGLDKMIKEQSGLKEPSIYEPETLQGLQLLGRQVGGVTDLQADAMKKLNVLGAGFYNSYLSGLKDLKGILPTVGQNPNGYQIFAKSDRMVEPMTNAQVAAETASKQQMQKAETQAEAMRTQASIEGLQGKITPAEFIARLKSINQAIVEANKSTQLGVQRFLEMTAGAKTPDEALKKSGLKLYQPNQQKH